MRMLIRFKRWLWQASCRQHGRLNRTLSQWLHRLHRHRKKKKQADTHPPACLTLPNPTIPHRALSDRTEADRASPDTTNAYRTAPTIQSIT